MTKPIIAHQIILKIASRCNLYCTYCHWFRDKEVFKEPKVFQKDVEDAFFVRLKSYLSRNPEIKELSLIFHGGEPLLFPKERYQAFFDKVDLLEKELDVKLPMAMTSNGTMMTDDWARFLLERRIGVSISLDGTEGMHDQHRIDRFGRGSHHKVLEGLQNLRSYGYDPGILTVCNLDHDPKELCEYFVGELGVKHFDVLIPNFTRDDVEKNLVRSIADYYIKLFDLWYDTYYDQGVRIRFFEALTRVLLGGTSNIQGMGQGILSTVEVLPSGAIEPHDVLRIGGNQNVKTNLNVRTHELDDVFGNRTWMEAYEASKEPAPECKSCHLLKVCGGGDVMHRYSSENSYANPSVYCDDLKKIYTHAARRIYRDLKFDKVLA